MFRTLSRQLRRAVTGVRAMSQPSNLPPFRNEHMHNYEPGSPQRAALQQALAKWKGKVTDVPVVVGGREHFANLKHVQQVMPSNHAHVVANVAQANEALVKEAIETASHARTAWTNAPFEDRVAVLLKAADLMSTKYRYDLLATTMLGQGKTVWQAEIDSVAEAIDFFRYNAKAAESLQATQPQLHSNTVWNRTIYRALEGFVAAVTPFNFTAIGANLAATPALMGNGVLWKPSNTAALSNYLVFQILVEAGMPAGVINFLPADGPLFGDAITSSASLAAINFTGSTKTFNHLWKQVATNLPNYRVYPRLIGECGGKNFHLVHNSAPVETVVAETIRSAFEYQGQKCSACSRAYFPASLWPQVPFNRLNFLLFLIGSLSFIFHRLCFLLFPWPLFRSFSIQSIYCISPHHPLAILSIESCCNCLH
eukprot:m.292013 g.292013  ORF g.292013 m.292013 type:complete len:425 (-) comp55104_c0_seq2:16-1290(-)